MSVIKPNVAHTMVFLEDSIFLNLVRGEREHENYGITHTIFHELVDENLKDIIVNYYNIDCRGCGNIYLKDVISFGLSPLANNLLKDKNQKDLENVKKINDIKRDLLEEGLSLFRFGTVNTGLQAVTRILDHRLGGENSPTRYDKILTQFGVPANSSNASPKSTVSSPENVDTTQTNTVSKDTLLEAFQVDTPEDLLNHPSHRQIPDQENNRWSRVSTGGNIYLFRFDPVSKGVIVKKRMYGN